MSIHTFARAPAHARATTATAAHAALPSVKTVQPAKRTVWPPVRGAHKPAP